MKTPLLLGLGAALALSASPAFAQQCASGTNAAAPFAGGNQFAGNMVDITIGASDVTIECLDINVSAVAGTPTTVDVWYCPTTCIGNDMNQLGNWVLIGTATGTAAGSNLPTNMDMSGNGVVLSAGQTYGLYIDYATEYAAGNGAFLYTNGTWGTPTYVGDDLDIDAYYGKGTPSFTGSTFGSQASGSTREWNGVLYTETGAGGPSLSLSCGGGSATADMSGCTPGGAVAVVYGPANPYVHGGAQCNGLALDLTPARAPLVLSADAAGAASVSKSVGGAVCGSGILVQAVDVSTCVATNSEAL